MDNENQKINTGEIMRKAVPLSCIMALLLALQPINLTYSANSPSARLGATMFYDSVNQRMVRARASAAPSARFGAIMFFDPVNQRVLLFGGGTQGTSGSALYNDMWTYDYETDSWIEVKTRNPPSGLFDFPAAYDSSKERLLILDNEGALWTFSVRDDSWTNLGLTGISPWRSSSPFVYDEKYERLILFSGMTGNPSGDRFPEDTWAYDSASMQWKKMIPTNTPEGRYGHTFVYDPVNKRTIMLGGHSWGNTTPRVDLLPEGVWSYDYQTDAWKQIDASATPTRRYWNAYSVNTDTGELTVFGGVDVESFLPDTWIFGDTGWRQVKSGTSPSGRQLAAMTYDPVHKVTLLFGGGGFENGKVTQFNDLWALDSNGNWQQLMGEGKATESPEETSPIDGYPISAIIIALIISIMIQRTFSHRSQNTSPRVGP